MTPNLSEILKMSIPERIMWVEAIWDSVAMETDKKRPYTLSDEQINILEEEMAAYKKNPAEGSSWEEVKNRITGK